jgi:riboflavin synthase
VFTGLVEAMGRIARRTPRGTGVRMAVEAALGELSLGESIAVNGACLTVVTHDARGFEADVSVETLERTTLGGLAPGSVVNLERAMLPTTRLGGHLVSGHVDGVGTVRSVAAAGEAQRVEVEPPSDLLPFIAEKGSITLDGVSLTVNRLVGNRFELMLIPHTMAVTTLSGIAPGRKANLEVDLVARYVVRYLTARNEPTEGGLEGALRRAGFVR